MALPRSVEPLETYSNLVTSVPRWAADLTSLRNHVMNKNAEFVAEYKRILAHAQPKRKKSSSLHSLRAADDGSEAEVPQIETLPGPSLPSAPANPIEISPFEAGNKYLYAQIKRKRKPDSSMRSAASGPQKFRTKQMVVIYYDSHVQDQLEILVKALGAARNELRKARQTNNLSKGLQLPRLARRTDTGYGLRENPLQRHAKGPSPVMSTGKPTYPLQPTTASSNAIDAHADHTFLTVDKDLETVQNLCETAAHQFLRDGDCKVELDNSLEHLQSALQISQEVKRQLDAEKKQAQESRAREEAAQTHQSQNLATSESEGSSYGMESEFTLYSARGSPPSNGVVVSKADAMDVQLSSHPEPIPSAQAIGLGTAEIEVDDDDNESEMSEVEIDIKQFRMARAAGIRA